MNPEYMRNLGSKGGKVGGKARAACLSEIRRSEIARNAALKRWGKSRMKNQEESNPQISFISGSQWLTADLSAILDMPKLPGVYAIYLDKEIVYIGASGNLRDRIRRHLRNRQSVGGIIRRFFPSAKMAVKYKFCLDTAVASNIEAKLIKRLKPKINHNGK